MLLLLLACTPSDPLEAAESEWIQDISVQTSPDIPAVITVSYSTPESLESWVEYGGEQLGERTTSATTGTAHTHHLLGLPPLTDTKLEIVVEVDGEEQRSGTLYELSGQLLPDTPLPQVTINRYNAPEHAVILMTLFGDPAYLIMMDLDGNVFWSLVQGVDDVRGGLACQPAVEEGLIFFNTFDVDGWADGLIESVSLDGAVVEQIETEGAHHFFERLPDKSLVWMAIDPREWKDLGTVVGDKLVHRQTDGTLTTLFSFWDHLTVYETETWNWPLYDGADWTHGNGLVYDETRDTFLVSTGGTNVIVELSASGDVLRMFGGEGAVDGDYNFNPPNSAFSYPHGVHYNADGELMMMSTVNDRSRLVAYSVSDSQLSLQETWSYGLELGHVVQVLGDIEELPDGNRLVSWGSMGILQIITPEGEVVWEAQMSFGQLIGKAHLLESPYRSWSQ